MFVKGQTLLTASIICLTVPSTNFARADNSGSLALTLKTDKQYYREGDEIKFSETYKNTGSAPIFVYVDTCYIGSDLEIERLADRIKTWETESSQTHTVKPGLRPSNGVTLNPGESHIRKFDALLTDNLTLAFQNHDGSAFTGFTPETKKTFALPAKFVGCGRIYKLNTAGEYKIDVRYDNDQAWSNGKSPPPIPWIGHCRSNVLTVKLEK